MRKLWSMFHAKYKYTDRTLWLVEETAERGISQKKTPKKQWKTKEKVNRHDFSSQSIKEPEAIK